MTFIVVVRFVIRITHEDIAPMSTDAIGMIFIADAALAIRTAIIDETPTCSGLPERAPQDAREALRSMPCREQRRIQGTAEGAALMIRQLATAWDGVAIEVNELNSGINEDGVFVGFPSGTLQLGAMLAHKRAFAEKRANERWTEAATSPDGNLHNGYAPMLWATYPYVPWGQRRE